MPLKFLSSAFSLKNKRKERRQTTFHEPARLCLNLKIVSFLTSNRFLPFSSNQRIELDIQQAIHPYQPNPSSPHLHPTSHPNTHISNPKMHHLPWLSVPKPTYQSGPSPPPPPPPPTLQTPTQINNNDIEQQAGANAPNPTTSNGENSVRTRLLSGLLLLAVIVLIVLILILTSVKLGKGH